MHKDYQTRNFTKKDDKQIVKLVKKLGRCWTLIASEMGNRFTAGRIQFRYDNYLIPRKGLDGPWYDEDMERLVDLVEKHGHKWAWLSQCFFQDRSPNFLRSKYRSYLANKKSEAAWQAEQERWRKLFQETQEKVMNEIFPDPPTEEDINFDLFSLDD